MANKNTILLLESATKVCSVALSQARKTIAIKESADGNRHSEWMTSYIEEVLKSQGLSYQNLDAIAVSEGPGSYTGLRVAYSIAKGMAYSLDIPMIAVDTLMSMAKEYINQENPSKNTIILPMIDARRMEVYTKAISADSTEIEALEARILDNHSFDTYIRYDKIVLLGDGAHKVQNLDLSKELTAKLSYYPEIVCSASYLKYEAHEKFEQENFLDVAYCVPHYLKSPNITTPKKSILPV